MAVSSIGSTPPTRIPEATEIKGPEAKSDGDADDAGASRPAVQAAVPAGQGKRVNKTA